MPGKPGVFGWIVVGLCLWLGAGLAHAAPLGLCLGQRGPALDSAPAMAAKVERFQLLVEENLSLRARAQVFFRQLKAREQAGEPLSGGDLRRLNEGAAQLLAQRQALLALAREHECWLERELPGDAAQAQVQASGIGMSLAAALLLYDNYLTVVTLYSSNLDIRQHLNRRDSGFALPAGALNRIERSFNSPLKRARVRRGLDWLDAHAAQLAVLDDEQHRYLRGLIEQSPSRRLIGQFRPVGYVGGLVDFYSGYSLDTLNLLKNESVNFSSLLFGNAVGLVETRRGKLYDRREVLLEVYGSLQPGDILLEKTPFRLTDAFIPGHWGHVAVWVGNEQQLRELGLWEHPLVRRYHKDIRKGRGVVEALRAGVSMSKLKHFLNVDDLAVLRHEQLSPAQRRDVVLQTLRQVGKAYDFNFDVETTDRIVCSELVYHAYGDLRWPVARHLGRATISPDNVAVLATGQGPFAVTLLYHRGQAVREDPRQRMAELVRDEVVRRARGELAQR